MTSFGHFLSIVSCCLFDRDSTKYQKRNRGCYKCAPDFFCVDEKKNGYKTCFIGNDFIIPKKSITFALENLMWKDLD